MAKSGLVDDSSMNGQDAEHYAASFLQQHNLILLDQNFRCRFGEIDLIMQDKQTLVFVEVRMRSSESFGGAAASISPGKQKKLLSTARYYLAKLSYEPACRFDAVLISGADHHIDWIKNAFGE